MANMDQDDYQQQQRVIGQWMTDAREARQVVIYLMSGNDGR